MINSRLLLIASALVALNACTTDSLGDAKYKAAVARAHEDRMLALRECDKFNGDAKDMCRTEAGVAQTKTVASAKAENLGTAVALTQAERDNADADWTLAKEKCNTFGGDTKAECLTKARATHEATIAEINANADEQEARWKSSVAECAQLAGTYRTTCMAETRAKYGR
jgi:hyperosmotically inducible periplasmic protein